MIFKDNDPIKDEMVKMNDLETTVYSLLHVVETLDDIETQQRHTRAREAIHRDSK